MYLDYSATTPVDKQVLKVMLPYFTEKFANPSSLYSLARENKRDIEQARQTIATILNCDTPEEIIFTSGGTESCNLAIDGIMQNAKSINQNPHIIISEIEHSAVLYCAQKYDCTILKVDSNGFIDLQELKKSIKPTTSLVSVMYVNNEIGTIQNISAISKICHEQNIPLHTDACQAAAYLNLDVKKLGVDLLSINGGKIYGPKGIGVLYKKEDLFFTPQIIGGEQENGLRAGTENVPLIIGMAKALELVTNEQENEKARITKLRNLLIAELTNLIPGIRINGPFDLNLKDDNRIANNINISIDGIEGESAVIRLDQKGIFVSTGSACSSHRVEPSHVLLAIGLDKNQAHSSLRISLGKYTTEDDIFLFLDHLQTVVSDLRNI